METKICNVCNNTKEIDNFHKDKSKKDGYRNKCKECQKKYLSKYYIINLNKITKINKEWRKKNLENILEQNKKWKKENLKKYNEIQLKYRNNNKDKIQKRTNEYNKYRKSIDPVYKLRCYLSRTFSTVLKEKNFIKQSKTVDILGCSFEEFKEYLESKFEAWMNWVNYGKPKDNIYKLNKTWDIDHIIPISTAKTEDDVIRLNYFTNLQPLCSFYNQRIKRNLL